MKQILFLILIGLMPFISKSQLNTGVYAGYDTHGNGMAAWSVGYSASIIELGAEIRPALTRNVFSNKYFGGRLGLNVINPDDAGLSVIVGGGYYYDLRSTDHKELNNNFYAAFIRSVIMITDTGGLSFDVMYINKSAQISVGMYVRFTKNSQ